MTWALDNSPGANVLGRSACEIVPVGIAFSISIAASEVYPVSVRE